MFLNGFSYADLPQTDTFFLTVAILAVALPAFLIFFLAPFSRKIKEIFYLTSITPLIKFRSVKKYDDDKFDEYEENESAAFKSNPGNFLTLYSGLNMILNMTAEKVIGEKITEGTSHEEVVRILLKKDVLTRIGAKKLKFLRWLELVVVSGGVGSVSQKTLEMGMVVLWKTQKEFNNWLSKNTN
jgi:hypothetical protein